VKLVRRIALQHLLVALVLLCPALRAQKPPAAADADSVREEIRDLFNRDFDEKERKYAVALLEDLNRILDANKPDEVKALRSWANELASIRKWDLFDLNYPTRLLQIFASHAFGRSLSKSHPNFLKQTSCPCTDAEAKENSAVWTPGFMIFGVLLSPACDGTHHPGAKSGYRSVSASADGHGQQCCYDTEGALITEGAAAGTPDLSAPIGLKGIINHYFDDVVTWEYLGWPVYNRYWVPNAGESCAVNRKNAPATTPKEISRATSFGPLAAAKDVPQPFEVRISTGRKTYRAGDGMKIGIRCEVDCYYALLHTSAGGLRVVAPREGDAKRLEAGRTVAFPSGGGILRVTPPAGREGFLLLASDQPIDLRALESLRFRDAVSGRVAFGVVEYEIEE
jgi:hypothetical protein